MSLEKIRIQNKEIITPKELLRPNLRAVFVGINPTPKSVSVGHYYQGNHGKRFWKRLQTFGIVSSLPEGNEDETAFTEGFGFADLVRKPTESAKDLSTEEFREGADELLKRLVSLGKTRPAVVCVYKTVFDYSAEAIQQAGFQVYRMPGPYAKKEDERKIMLKLAKQLDL